MMPHDSKNAAMQSIACTGTHRLRAMWRVYLRWKLRERNVALSGLHGPQAVPSMSLVALLTPFARQLLLGLLCVTTYRPVCSES